MPTCWRVAALAPAPARPWPSLPIAGVSASKVTSTRSRVGRGLASPGEVADDRVGVGGEPPLAHRLDPLVADAGHGEVAVGHLALRADAVRSRRARSPGSHTESPTSIVPSFGRMPMRVKRPGVGHRVVGVEVVGLAPGGVGLDGMGEVVGGVEDRHGGRF